MPPLASIGLQFGRLERLAVYEVFQVTLNRYESPSRLGRSIEYR